MFKKSILVLSFVSFILIGAALATDCDDFIKEDLDLVLKGCKNLAGIKIEGANLRGMDLRGVDFKGAELEQVNFENADLRNVNFHNADLEEANLKGAKIEGANFKNAEFEYAIWVDGRVCAEGSIGGCW